MPDIYKQGCSYLISKNNFRLVSFLLALANISLLSLYLSNNRGLTNSYNLYRLCLFNLLLIVIKDILVFCLLIDVEISASILILYFFTIEIISRSSFFEVFLFLPLSSSSFISLVS